MISGHFRVKSGHFRSFQVISGDFRQFHCHFHKPALYEDAKNSQLFPTDIMQYVKDANKAFAGFSKSYGSEQYSLLQAIKAEIILERPGMKMIEAQLATGGIIDSRSKLRLSLDVACKKQLVDQTLADKMKASPGSYSA